MVVVVLIALCLLGPAQALTIYRIGGADQSPPALDTAFDFIQIAWEDVDPQAHGRADLLDVQHQRVIPQTMDPNANLAPQIEALGGRILILEWNGWQQWRDDDVLIFDGDPETAYLGDGHYLRVAGYGPQNKYWVFDFGGRFFIDRIRFFPRQQFQFNRFVERFTVGVSDGDPLKEGTREYVVDWRGSALDFDIVHRVSENTEPFIELAFPEEPIKQLFVEFPENTRGIWEIAEFEIYGKGAVAQATYTSNIIDLGGPAVLGPIRWGGETPGGSKIDLSIRTGDDDDPNTYWRSTFRGEERTRFDSRGRPLTLAGYNRLARGEQDGITADTENWEFWSVPFEFAAGQGTVPTDRLRRYVQINADFHSNAETGGRLDYIELAVSIPPVASSLIAEIFPSRVAARTPTLFTYTIDPRLEADDLGFDRLAIDTPERVQGVEAVRIGGVDIAVETSRLDDDGFEVVLPRIDRQRSREQIEVYFWAEVFAFNTVFSGRVRDSTRPFEVPQPITVQVDLLNLDQHIIGTFDLNPAVFTPNGDGVNDQLQIAFDLLYLVNTIDVEIMVYDLAGRAVAQALRLQAASGHFTSTWNGRDDDTKLLPPGLYMLRLTTKTDEGEEHSQRLISLVY